jgi:hypothetical protein
LEITFSRHYVHCVNVLLRMYLSLEDMFISSALPVLAVRKTLLLHV